MEDKVLEVRLSNVLKAAKACSSDANRILRILFPEAFTETGYLIGTIFAKEADPEYRFILATRGSGQSQLIDLTNGKTWKSRYFRTTRRAIGDPLMTIIPDELLSGLVKVSEPQQKTIQDNEELNDDEE